MSNIAMTMALVPFGETKRGRGVHLAGMFVFVCVAGYATGIELTHGVSDALQIRRVGVIPNGAEYLPWGFAFMATALASLVLTVSTKVIQGMHAALIDVTEQEGAAFKTLRIVFFLLPAALSFLLYMNANSFGRTIGEQETLKVRLDGPEKFEVVRDLTTGKDTRPGQLVGCNGEFCVFHDGYQPVVLKKATISFEQ